MPPGGHVCSQLGPLTVMAASAAVDPMKLIHLPQRIASRAAMKNVLSPSSLRKMRLRVWQGGGACRLLALRGVCDGLPSTLAGQLHICAQQPAGRAGGCNASSSTSCRSPT